MSNSKDVLNKALADLLGFDDGAEDVLEHLLSIESREDLLDYLSQLLGQDGENVKSFVDNVGKYQRGETLSNSSSLQSETATKKPVVAEEPRQQQDHYMERLQGNRGKQQQGRGNKQQAAKKPPSKAPTTVAKKIAAVQANNSAKQPPAVTKKNSPAAAAAPKQSEEAQKIVVAAPKRAPPPKKSHPKKGTASYVCGCFGTVHKPLSNCLYCGRVSCLKEGFDFCPFCELMVEKVDVKPPKEGAKNKAWLHKERLLRFDRDFAQRTVVLDDQEDYYANTTSNWLTEDEKLDAKDQEEVRRKDMHERKRQTLSLNF
mmetsp:Transcript_1136/g.1847  ORF Transcript_1136/g.1847 Transcript_1136/m.1847 type:complete len:315 (-) Transcript_1136:50-994(-)